jgi:cytochrome P450
VQDKAEITGGTKHFMAFGGGLRFCVGTDLSKVLMATFIHCLVTKYRYQYRNTRNIVLGASDEKGGIYIKINLIIAVGGL